MTQMSRPFHWIVPGLLIGGEKKKSEKARIRKGLTLVAGTSLKDLDTKNEPCRPRSGWCAVHRCQRPSHTNRKTDRQKVADTTRVKGRSRVPNSERVVDRDTRTFGRPHRFNPELQPGSETNLCLEK